MKSILAVLTVCFLLSFPAPAQKSSKSSQPPPQFTQRVTREVRHQILMLPYYSEFDVIGFKVQGYTVTLYGKVVRPSLKDDAANSIKKIEGVEHVNNQIEVLPPSPMDDRLRARLFRAIYGYSSLQRYGVGSNRPIHIIVDRGHVTLEGVVDNQADKNVAGIRANSVPGIFSVKNNLAVAPGNAKKQT
ncbi:MAG TPA: BON domain-containing protein [Candidatus Angelobacter sp.]|nr:BON domain-containing protein [Candidatus Angelobacter sp.]